MPIDDRHKADFVRLVSLRKFDESTANLFQLAGHVKGMQVPAKFYASPELLKLVSHEFHTASGGFTGAVQQLANVATLPGLNPLVLLAC